MMQKLSPPYSEERTGQEGGNASEKHHKCCLQLTDELETVCSVSCKVHTVMNNYNKMGLSLCFSEKASQPAYLI